MLACCILAILIYFFRIILGFDICPGGFVRQSLKELVTSRLTKRFSTQGWQPLSCQVLSQSTHTSQAQQQEELPFSITCYVQGYASPLCESPVVLIQVYAAFLAHMRSQLHHSQVK
jgi:hypothetical protein